ncbi:MAG: hypothetical protein WBZ01_02265 [Terriglobales bacterium]|jgi:hypothetical protein
MSSLAAARCRHIKVSGIQCGSPALRKKDFCFYHQQNRPIAVECYSEGKYATGEIALPVFEDAHSVQAVIRQVVQMVLQKRIERKTASLLLYALQIASSNLKRMELEKPQPEQVVTDPETIGLETVSQTPLDPNQASHEAKTDGINSQDLPPGTIQACHRPGSQTRIRPGQQRKKQYVI